MAAHLSDYVLDNGLAALDTEATGIYICSAEPASYTDAVNEDTDSPAGYKLGVKVFGAGGVFGAPADGDPTGRKISSAAVSDGSITDTGTATYWAICDTANSRLLAWGALVSPQAVTDGNTFTLPSFDITLPGESV